MCDRLAVLSDGSLIACDTPKNLLDRGHTRVHVWRGTERIVESVENYAESLPRLLERYGLDSSVTRIEIERDTLEQIILGWIKK